MKMKHTFALLCALMAMAVCAQTPEQMLDLTVSTYKKGGTVSAVYKVSGAQGKSVGTITMSGTKYRLVSQDMKCWYDGKTMWTYSKATDEVNVTTPTAAELQQANPYAAAQDFKQNYTMTRAIYNDKTAYVILLKPKKKSQITKIFLYIDTRTNLVRTVNVTQSDGSNYIIRLTNYKTGVKAPSSMFTFDKSMVPAGTEVVDLR